MLGIRSFFSLFASRLKDLFALRRETRESRMRAGFERFVAEVERPVRLVNDVDCARVASGIEYISDMLSEPRSTHSRDLVSKALSSRHLMEAVARLAFDRKCFGTKYAGIGREYLSVVKTAYLDRHLCFEAIRDLLFVPEGTNSAGVGYGKYGCYASAMLSAELLDRFDVVAFANVINMSLVNTYLESETIQTRRESWSRALSDTPAYGQYGDQSFQSVLESNTEAFGHLATQLRDLGFLQEPCSHDGWEGGKDIPARYDDDRISLASLGSVESWGSDLELFDDVVPGAGRVKTVGTRDPSTTLDAASPLARQLMAALEEWRLKRASEDTHRS